MFTFLVHGLVWVGTKVSGKFGKFFNDFDTFDLRK